MSHSSHLHPEDRLAAIPIVQGLRLLILLMPMAKSKKSNKIRRQHEMMQSRRGDSDEKSTKLQVSKYSTESDLPTSSITPMTSLSIVNGNDTERKRAWDATEIISLPTPEISHGNQRDSSLLPSKKKRRKNKRPKKKSTTTQCSGDENDASTLNSEHEPQKNGTFFHFDGEIYHACIEADKIFPFFGCVVLVFGQKSCKRKRGRYRLFL